MRSLNFIFIFILGFGFLNFAHAADPVKKLATELAELVVEYEKLLEPGIVEGGPFRVGADQNGATALVPSNLSRAIEIGEQISDRLVQIEPLINGVSHTSANDTIRSNLRAFVETSGGKKGLAHLGAFMVETVIALSPYAPLHWSLRVTLLGKALYMGFKAYVYAFEARDDATYRKNLEEEKYDKNRRKFYETLRKELKRLGSKTVLPKWGELDSKARALACEQLFLKALDFKLLPVGSGNID